MNAGIVFEYDNVEDSYMEAVDALMNSLCNVKGKQPETSENPDSHGKEIVLYEGDFLSKYIPKRLHKPSAIIMSPFTTDFGSSMSKQKV